MFSRVAISKFVCIDFFREESILNKNFGRVFTCLETSETIKALYRREHIERENIIYKQGFDCSKIMKRAFEFRKQIIAIKTILFIVLNVDL